MQNIFFLFAFCSIQYFTFVILRYLWFAGEKMWFVKAFVKRNVRYTERIYKTCVGVEKREMDFGS